MTCPAPRHSTPTAYRWDRCRCPEAIEAQRLYAKRLRFKRDRGVPVKVPVIGTLRRIEALMALGWPRHEIMRRAGYSPSGWPARGELMHIETHQRFVDVYDDLSMRIGPSQWTVTYARNRGFAPPLAWDEGDLDDPAAQPWRPGPQAIGRPQRDVAGEYLHLSALGESFEQIAAQLGLQPQSLQRTLERYGVGA